MWRINVLFSVADEVLASADVNRRSSQRWCSVSFELQATLSHSAALWSVEACGLTAPCAHSGPTAIVEAALELWRQPSTLERLMPKDNGLVYVEMLMCRRDAMYAMVLVRSSHLGPLAGAK